jgi:hypothetical protein
MMRGLCFRSIPGMNIRVKVKLRQETEVKALRYTLTKDPRKQQEQVIDLGCGHWDSSETLNSGVQQWVTRFQGRVLGPVDSTG